MFLTYFLLGLVIISFVLNPFSKKKASSHLTSQEYFLVNHFMITILAVIYGIYLLYNQKCDINCLKKMTRGEVIWSIFAAFLGIIGSVALIMLIQRDEITFIMPNVQPIVILIGAIIGYFAFQESMSIIKITGIAFILFGAVFINYDKIKKGFSSTK